MRPVSTSRSLKLSRDGSVQAVMLSLEEQTQPAESTVTEAGKEYTETPACRRDSQQSGIGRGEQQSANAGCRAQRGKVWLGADVRRSRAVFAVSETESAAFRSLQKLPRPACWIDDCRLEYSGGSWSGLVCVGVGVGLGTLWDLIIPKVAVDG